MQVVTNAKELHEPAARSSLSQLRTGSSHEMFVKAASYFLGEFGHMLGPSEPPLGYASKARLVSNPMFDWGLG